MNSVLLDKQKHNRKHFNCGVKSLNNYLCLMANQQSVRDNTRTYVLEDKNPEYIIGFYTLTMTPVDLNRLPKQLQKKHQHIHSAGLIARLAVDQRFAKQGYGEWLLIDALKKMLLASDTVAFPFVIVDAKEGAIEFYKKFGFTSFLDTPNKLFMTIADIRESLS